MKPPKDIIGSLASLGLSTEQAQCYWSLLRCQPASAYQIARDAGLASTSIYTILHDLTALQVIYAVSPESEVAQQRFAAVDPESLIDTLQKRQQRLASRVLPTLQEQVRPSRISAIWPLDKRQDFLDTALTLLTQSRRSVEAALHAKEYEDLHAGFQRFAESTQRYALIQLGKGPQQEHFQQHLPCDESRRGFYLVVDGSLALIAQCQADGLTQGCWSDQAAFVQSVKDHLRTIHVLAATWDYLPPKLRATMRTS